MRRAAAGGRGDPGPAKCLAALPDPSKHRSGGLSPGLEALYLLADPDSKELLVAGGFNDNWVLRYTEDECELESEGLGGSNMVGFGVDQHGHHDADLSVPFAAQPDLLVFDGSGVIVMGGQDGGIDGAPTWSS